MKLYKYYLLALGVIVLDQVVKLLVHFNMEMGTIGEIDVFGEWFKLHYLLNPGMAFGLKSSHEYGKLLLTLFRLGAMVGIGYYIYYLYNKKAKTGLLWCMGLILGGAVGNVIDSTFYGVLLDNAPAGSPTPWFHGQVVDMLFFPLFDGYYPDWVPFVGGDYFLFFSPVFNIADSSIFIGVVLILIFQKKFFKDRDNKGTITDDVNEEGLFDKESKEVIIS
ncbi:lipoprotein signal peptidase [Fulvivirga sp. 29W222]|uniref:Lipoprotein signal peptidase n=1 Tax=Fulvivirga marina TaxID=2494733 RepID=A0A937G3T1_9BACT|nr:lipoprotein signal peptidase [Fulvivirga marina]MBL6449893.1 lipoprotein signal peptidase [Fulvivirga marina]